MDEHMVSIYTILILTFFLSSGLHAQSCHSTCQPPDCSCPRLDYPMPTRDIPQMVYFGFDDAVNVVMSSLYERIFTRKRKNPNGCRMKMSLFVSHQYTDYRKVKKFYDQGHEIGVHSVTHTAIHTPESLRKEAKQQKENIVRAGVPAEEIIGWRSPFLKTAGTEQPYILQELGYEYDISLTYTRSSMADAKPWPFTMDHGWPYPCGVEPCPVTASVEKFWAVPVVSLMDHKDKYPCPFVDGCAVPALNQRQAYDFLWKNFMSYYNTTRAPFGLNMHAAWFYRRHNLKAMMRFLDDLMNLDDVYVVTVKQMLDWMKRPTSLRHLDTLQSWQCAESKLRRPRKQRTTKSPPTPKRRAINFFGLFRTPLVFSNRNPTVVTRKRYLSTTRRPWTPRPWGRRLIRTTATTTTSTPRPWFRRVRTTSTTTPRTTTTSTTTTTTPTTTTTRSTTTKSTTTKPTTTTSPTTRQTTISSTTTTPKTTETSTTTTPKSTTTTSTTTIYRSTTPTKTKFKTTSHTTSTPTTISTTTTHMPTTTASTTTTITPTTTTASTTPTTTTMTTQTMPTTITTTIKTTTRPITTSPMSSTKTTPTTKPAPTSATASESTAATIPTKTITDYSEASTTTQAPRRKTSLKFDIANSELKSNDPPTNDLLDSVLKRGLSLLRKMNPFADIFVDLEQKQAPSNTNDHDHGSNNHGHSHSHSHDMNRTGVQNKVLASQSTTKSAPQHHSQFKHCVQGINCVLPTCFCQGRDIPDGLKLHETPQMIFITVDGGVNPRMYRRYKQIFNGRRNPNNCRARGTVFATESGSNPEVVRRIVSAGAEIAMQGLHEHHYDTVEHMEQEIQHQKTSLQQSGVVGTKGWKTPELKAMGNEQFRLLQQYGFLYDATLSMTFPKDGNSNPWPFTLDFGFQGDCVIPECPTERFPGIWEIPSIPVLDYKGMYGCAYVDGCMFNPPTANDTETFLWNNFMSHYRSNKAPFGLHLRELWFSHSAYKPNLQGLKDFLNRVQKMKDVYLVSASDIIEWIQNPTPLDSITNTRPWNCS